VVQGLGFLGLSLDEDANATGAPERRISSPTSSPEVWVVPTDEEREIAREALEVLGIQSRL
jgi:acetate kinase